MIVRAEYRIHAFNKLSFAAGHSSPVSNLPHPEGFVQQPVVPVSRIAHYQNSGDRPRYAPKLHVGIGFLPEKPPMRS
jgi:hypothetical protein